MINESLRRQEMDVNLKDVLGNAIVLFGNEGVGGKEQLLTFDEQLCVAPEISEAPKQHGFKTMQHTLHFIKLPLADIQGLLMTSGGVRQELRLSQEGVDLRDQKKTPKQAGGRIGKQDKYTEEGSWL